VSDPLDEATRLKNLDSMNRFLRGETTEWKSPNDVTYRRVVKDGRAYFERSYADGATTTDEITQDLQELFSWVAATDNPEELDRHFRERGLPLPGDPKAPKQN